MAVESEREVRRTTNPGVRVVGGRIYDSSKGKTCHQCRQKTMDFAAFCTVMKKNKPCPIKYCHKCLMNRYGEKAEEVALLEEWTCPKCRGICNCSFCMKKRGHQPTGILVHTAKATGFSSVSELLHVKGPENFCYHRSAKPENLVTAPRKPGRENAIEGKCDLLNGEPHVNGDENAGDESSPNMIKISADISEHVSEKVSEEGTDQEVAKVVENNNVEGMIKNPRATLKLKKCDVEHKNEDYLFHAQLPEGISSISISGIDLPPEHVGHVLQFLEFCSAFGQVLGLREGQGECVVRELLNGRDKRGQECSMLIQMIIQLLCVILADRGEKSPSFTPADEIWFKALGECVSKSGLLDEFPPELFEKGVAEYENLDTSKKLKLLNFLCDETLCTTVMRNWIDKQNLDYDERKRGAREKVAAAKEKEKQLKQKLQDEVATAIMAESRDPLSISEHEAIVSRIKAEVKEAHAETVEAMGMRPKKRKRSDALRTDPFMLDENGRVFWRLTSYTEEPKLLLQDVGSWGEVCPHENWVTFKPEQQPEIEKYLSCLRMKQKRRAQTYANNVASVSIQGTETEANPQVP
ncbi:PREDICTED: uncharacterized protein LOC104805549 [Tarenaya hassleriana]|uniref:uncharacterized protein LOC104805549 n=1 Tax=Tarenaya hassleriana TaxID=28532 RepID=UPI00053C8B23|nr:PREDICTED: uncharacterized protein LOC104805549 [Tarenaya hassleriana]